MKFFQVHCTCTLQVVCLPSWSLLQDCSMPVNPCCSCCWVDLCQNIFSAVPLSSTCRSTCALLLGCEGVIQKTFGVEPSVCSPLFYDVRHKTRHITCVDCTDIIQHDLLRLPPRQLSLFARKLTRYDLLQLKDLVKMISKPSSGRQSSAGSPVNPGYMGCGDESSQSGNSQSDNSQSDNSQSGNSQGPETTYQAGCKVLHEKARAAIGPQRVERICKYSTRVLLGATLVLILLHKTLSSFLEEVRVQFFASQLPSSSMIKHVAIFIPGTGRLTFPSRQCWKFQDLKPQSCPRLCSRPGI